MFMPLLIEGITGGIYRLRMGVMPAVGGTVLGLLIRHVVIIFGLPQGCVLKSHLYVPSALTSIQFCGISHVHVLAASR